MANSYKGKIEAIESVQSIARNGKEPFQKRRIMLDATRFDGLTGERGYEKHIIFEFSGKAASIPDGFKKGDLVEVFFDVESYKGTKKDGSSDWFTSVRGYKISPLQQATQPVNPGQQPSFQAAPQQNAFQSAPSAGTSYAETDAPF